MAMLQSTSSSLSAPVIKLDIGVCRSYVMSLLQARIKLSSLDNLSDPVIFKNCCANINIITNDIKSFVVQNIEDPSCGIVAIDIPEGVGENINEDTKYGAVIAACVFSQFMTPAIDGLNNTPFTLYNASVGNERQLHEAGVKFFSPNEKLGFHTDGRLTGSSVYIPDYIALYNLLIAYRRPGNFYWIPFSLWDELSQYVDRIGLNATYKFELTPIVYSGAKLDANKSSRIIEAPIFTKRASGETNIFLNGDVIGAPSKESGSVCELINDMKNSISKNSRRYLIPQCTRRIMMMKNTSGFHARDVFEGPIGKTSYTRSFMRAISMEGPQIC